MDRLKAFPKFPELASERLRLREITMDDLEWYFKHFSTKEIVEGQEFAAPKVLEEAKEEMRLYVVDLFNERRGFRWGIEKKGEGELIGSCGLYAWVMPAGHKAELGYDLNPVHWGQGIMTEALTTMIDFGFDKMELNRIEVLISPRNERSARLVTRLGFKKEGVLRQHSLNQFGNPSDDVMFSLLRNEWDDLKSAREPSPV